MAWFLFFVVAVGWGSTFLGIHGALKGFTAPGLVAVRNLLAAAGALVLARARGEAWPPLERWPWILGTGLLLVLAPNLCTALAQGTLSTGLAGLLNATISLWIVLLALPEERPAPRAWAGLALGLLGVALLLLPGDRVRIHWTGFLLMMASTFGFSLGSQLQRRRALQGGTFAVLALQMGISGLGASLVAAFGPGFCHAAPSPSVWISLAFLAGVPSLASYAAFAALSRRWPPSRYGIYAVLTPGVAVLLGTGVLGEALTPRMLLAMGVILLGVVLVQRR